jgi:hypothetical protein
MTIELQFVERVVLQKHFALIDRRRRVVRRHENGCIRSERIAIAIALDEIIFREVERLQRRKICAGIVGVGCTLSNGRRRRCGFCRSNSSEDGAGRFRVTAARDDSPSRDSDERDARDAFQCGAHFGDPVGGGAGGGTVGGVPAELDDAGATFGVWKVVAKHLAFK